jgi:hypothetical protein
LNETHKEEFELFKQLDSSFCVDLNLKIRLHSKNTDGNGIPYLPSKYENERIRLHKNNRKNQTMTQAYIRLKVKAKPFTDKNHFFIEQRASTKK